MAWITDIEDRQSGALADVSIRALRGNRACHATGLTHKFDVRGVLWGLVVQNRIRRSTTAGCGIPMCDPKVVSACRSSFPHNLRGKRALGIVVGGDEGRCVLLVQIQVCVGTWTQVAGCKAVLLALLQVNGEPVLITHGMQVEDQRLAKLKDQGLRRPVGRLGGVWSREAEGRSLLGDVVRVICLGYDAGRVNLGIERAAGFGRRSRGAVCGCAHHGRATGV